MVKQSQGKIAVLVEQCQAGGWRLTVQSDSQLLMVYTAARLIEVLEVAATLQLHVTNTHPLSTGVSDAA